MAVPKKRTSKSKKGMRRSHDHITPRQFQRCSHCGVAIQPHRVCGNCGHYAGRAVTETEEF